MLFLFAFITSVLGMAINVALYFNDPNPWSLGGAVFCGSLAIFNLVQAVNE